MITPTNEQGVVVLFQEISKEMGYDIISVQTRFPDAMVLERKSKTEYRVEFEYRSSNFLLHKHDWNGCDLIICWIDDIPEDTPILILSLQDYLNGKKEKKVQRALQQFQVGGFISISTWYLLGLSLLFVSDDISIKTISGGNLIISTLVLLGLLVFSKSKY